MLQPLNVCREFLMSGKRQFDESVLTREAFLLSRVFLFGFFLMICYTEYRSTASRLKTTEEVNHYDHCF